MPDYAHIAETLRRHLPADTVFTDRLRRVTYSTDASFYRMTPEIVVKVDTEEAVAMILREANSHSTPVTFRAAGTSLSGQAVSDSILIKLGDRGFRQAIISTDGTHATFGAAIIGAEANVALAPHQRKIGPDPASINSAMIGGIAGNNASGMCCGTAQNTYNTLESIRLVLVDGTVLDTGDSESRRQFAASHAALLADLAALGNSARNNTALQERIQRKYAIKNTTGYSLNALIDFEDPFDILAHLLIGSEGTLAFISSVTYRTVEEAAYKASALAIFPTIDEAARCIPSISQLAVSSAEIMDYASLQSVMGAPGMPHWLAQVPIGSAALLIETRSATADHLTSQISDLKSALSAAPLWQPVEFTTDPHVYHQYWAVRKGLFPAVGARRKPGTTVIIEDVAFHQEQLAPAIADIQALFIKHGYPEGIIFGHALAGNIHFVITQAFSTETEIKQYADFMTDLSELVIRKHDGSMKAEHGTGRNVSPFVEMEWGSQAYGLMKQIKALFDPKGLLNPGVILNDDSQAHLKNLKQITPVDDIVDRCIECGFCEPVCPSKRITLTPRQRIAGLREIKQLQLHGTNKVNAVQMKKDFVYQGLDTCAACSLCSVSCPVSVDMGDMTRQLRGEALTGINRSLLSMTANHFGLANRLATVGLGTIQTMQKVLGDSATAGIMNLASTVTGGAVPKWFREWPGAARLPSTTISDPNFTIHPSPFTLSSTVVYFPACPGRMFGPSKNEPNDSVPEVMVRLMKKAGYNVILPPQTRSLCCGQLWQSKGDPETAKLKRDELLGVLRELSDNGRHPIISDSSSCSSSILESQPDLKLLNATRFIAEEILPRLKITKKKEPIALFVGCSSVHLHETAILRTLAAACAETVIEPSGVACCGFAGDRGLFFPELNESALSGVKEQLPSTVTEGYSDNRGCEIGLSKATSRPYRHIAYLVDDCTASR